ncbi:hypothetical protein WJX74_003528 [Apatococcus lobatus]|uniref:RAP domain-containing protein n=1 Tax=Apatococcus lobatus TaxID=904363 RepID=A0AAW1S9C7_9CHLO
MVPGPRPPPGPKPPPGSPAIKPQSTALQAIQLQTTSFSTPSGGAVSSYTARPSITVLGKRGHNGEPISMAMQSYIQINRRITACTSAEAVLDVVKESGDSFDPVAIATATHKIASFRKPAVYYRQLCQDEAFKRLVKLIGEKLATTTARNLANIVWAFAKMEYDPGQQLLQEVADELATKAASCNPQNVANSVWAFGSLGFHPGDDDLQKLAEAAKDKLNDFVPQNLSNTLLGFAKLDWIEESFLLALVETSMRKLEEFTPQALSNTAWACSKLGVYSKEFLDAIAQEATKKLNKFNAQNIANLIWAFASLAQSGDKSTFIDLFDGAAAAAEKQMGSFSPQNAANTIWAFAKLEHPVPSLMKAVAGHAEWSIKEYQPQSVANLVWALATLQGEPGAGLLQSVAAHFKSNLKEYSPQNLANTVWALATIKYTNKELLNAVAHEVSLRLKVTAGRQLPIENSSSTMFTRQHLANILWAYATLETHPGVAMLRLAIHDLAILAPACNPQELSNSVWALARLGHYDADFMEIVAGEAESRISEFSQQNLANTAWAFSKISHFRQSLLDAIADQAVAIFEELSLQHVTNIMWTLASFNHVLPCVSEIFVPKLVKRMGEEAFNAQQLCNLLWSEAIMQESWDMLMGKFTELAEELPEEGLTQVYQAYLLVKLGSVNAEGSAPPGLLERAHEMWKKSATHVRVSFLHRDVSRVLTMLGHEHFIEQMTEDRLFSMDISLAREKVCIEVDGPHHFSANTLRPSGENLARQRLLRARGWAVVSIPFFKWSDKDDDDHVKLLQSEILMARAELAKQQGWEAEGAHLLHVLDERHFATPAPPPGPYHAPHISMAPAPHHQPAQLSAPPNIHYQYHSLPRLG